MDASHLDAPTPAAAQTVQVTCSPSRPEATPLLGLFAQAAHDLRGHVGDLLRYALLFEGLSFVFLAPLLAWLFRRMALVSGDMAFGNLDILRFLLTPSGAVTVATCGALLVAVSLARLAGYLRIGAVAAAGQRETWFGALRFVAARFPRILGVGCAVVAALALVLLPFLAAALATAKLLLTDHDINFYLDARPPEFIRAVWIGIGLGVAATGALAVSSGPLLFVLPDALLANRPARVAFQEGRALARAVGRLRVILAIAIWGMAWIATTLLAGFLLHTVGRLAIAAAGERIGWLLGVLGTLAVVEVTAGFLISLGATTLGCFAIVRLFREACRRLGVELTAAGGHAATVSSSNRFLPRRWIVISGVAAAVALAATAAHAIVAGAHLEDQVEISAHRGASLAAPENTLAAVRGAIDAGANRVEVDVQRTADGIVVVNHDADLMRVAGQSLVISQSTFADLREADLGASRGPEFAGERLPTLEEVFDAAAGRVNILVELKTYRGDRDALVAEVVRLIRDRGIQTTTALMSLEYREVQAVKRLAPELECGLIVSASLGNISRLDCDFLAVAKSHATPAFIAAAHAAGKEVFVWTVDDPREMSILIERGVDNLITNDPAAATALLRERADLDNPKRLLLRFRSLYQ